MYLPTASGGAPRHISALISLIASSFAGMTAFFSFLSLLCVCLGLLLIFFSVGSRGSLTRHVVIINFHTNVRAHTRDSQSLSHLFAPSKIEYDRRLRSRCSLI